MTELEQGERPVHFTVDSALLRQLGERLVGRPAVALAELVKNSYDADATRVEIHIGADEVTVADDGAGMSEVEFEAFWMRVGSPHKERQSFSPRLGRPLTGSKGVGRLAVQFLATQVNVRTVSESSPEKELRARVDWAKARSVGNLTEATAAVRVGQSGRGFAGDSTTGTAISLRGLRQAWSSEEVERLARELWTLQPPFAALQPGKGKERKASDAGSFQIVLTSDKAALEETFGRQMSAALGLWEARILGRYTRGEGGDVGNADVVVEFQGGKPVRHGFTVGGEGDQGEVPALDRLEYEIRVFKLQGRQGAGVKVQDARDYLAEYGGVHVYDAGFRLPYYGVETDWLNIERDHSHRLSASALLPKELQVDRGMNFLPTNTRLFGVVRVSTSHEAKVFGQATAHPLAISVTRDRLVEGRASDQLRRIVRWGLDFYAMQAAARAAADQATSAAVLPLAARKLEDDLERVFAQAGARIPSEDRERIFLGLRTLARRTSELIESDRNAPIAALLGPLATAGITALAYDHELVKQFHLLEGVASQLAAEASPSARETAGQIRTWIERARATRSLFSHLGSAENRDDVRRLNAKQVLDDVIHRSRFLLRGVVCETEGVSRELPLPPGTFAEWSAIVQNVLLNAANAMTESEIHRIRISSAVSGSKRSLHFEDTGVGVDVESSESLFSPFARSTSLSAERVAMGLGGTGLGLTIVRLIAESRSCTARFVPPSEGFATCLALDWQERPT